MEHRQMFCSNSWQYVSSKLVHAPIVGTYFIRKSKTLFFKYFIYLLHSRTGKSLWSNKPCLLCRQRPRKSKKSLYLLFTSPALQSKHKKKVTPKIPIEFIFCISSRLRKSSYKINYPRYVSNKQINGFDEVTLLKTVDQNRDRKPLSIWHIPFFVGIVL